MENLHYHLNFGNLCAKYQLGHVSSEPEQVFGGFLHRMYHLSASNISVVDWHDYADFIPLAAEWLSENDE